MKEHLVTKRVIGGVALSLALVAASCGSDSGVDAVANTTTSETQHLAGDHMDVGHTRAPDIEGAEVRSGHFRRLDTALSGFDRVDGHAWPARHEGGTTVTLEMHGLEPNARFVSHVHAGVCAEGGGPHYQFTADGVSQPPNEIHLVFASDEHGRAVLTVDNDQVAGPEAQSLVVHPANGMDAKVACAELG